MGGEKEARRLASQPPQGTLSLVNGEGINEINTNNIFIEGDNLEVLRILQKSYMNRIKLIYIDPRIIQAMTLFIVTIIKNQWKLIYSVLLKQMKRGY